MAIEHGLYKYITITPSGASGISVPITSAGMKFESDVGAVNTVGSRKARLLYPSLIKYGGSFEAIVVPGIIDVLKLIYTEDNFGFLKTFSIDDGTNRLTGCRMSSLKLSIAVGKTITASAEFVATGKDTGTAGSEPDVSVAFVPDNITLSGIADYDCDAIDISISNSLKEVYGMKGTDSRLPKAVTEAEQKTTVDVKYIENPNIDVESITMIDSATISIKGTDGMTTLTISLSELLASSVDKDTKIDDIIRFGVSYQAKEVSFSIA